MDPMQDVLDLQVNGYAGVDFNATRLTTEEILRACEALRRDGVHRILATVISAPLDFMEHRLVQLAQARRESSMVAEVMVGVHVEGPFLNPEDGYRGAHPANLLMAALPQVAGRLIKAGQGEVKLITLSPEVDAGFATTRMLANDGVKVAAGHSNASLEVLSAACDAGVTIFTHLGNGCPALLPRHDNIVQRALALSSRLWCCFIADGNHIPWHALGNYLRLVGNRAIVVSDSMAAAGMGQGRFSLGAMEVAVGSDKVARQPGSQLLAGAVVPLPEAALKLQEYLGLSPQEVHQMLVRNPRRALGL